MSPFVVLLILILVVAVALTAFRQARAGVDGGRGARSRRSTADGMSGYAPLYYTGATDGGQTDPGSPSGPDGTPDAGRGWGGGSDGGGGGGAMVEVAVVVAKGCAIMHLFTSQPRRSSSPMS